MQDIMDDTESEDAYIPVNEADSTMYYDTEVSMIPDEEANTSYHNEEVNNAPHRNQDEASQSLEHNMESTANTSQDENNHNEEKQNNMEPASEDTNVGTLLDEEMDAKYGSQSTRWNL